MRDTLSFTWLSHPLTPAVRRTRSLLRTVPHDTASARAFAQAAAGLPWVPDNANPFHATGEQTEQTRGRATTFHGAPRHRLITAPTVSTGVVAQRSPHRSATAAR